VLAFMSCMPFHLLDFVACFRHGTLIGCHVSQEKQLLDRSKAFDTAVQNRDPTAVEALLAPDVTVHKGTCCASSHRVSSAD